MFKAKLELSGTEGCRDVSLFSVKLVRRINLLLVLFPIGKILLEAPLHCLLSSSRTTNNSLSSKKVNLYLLLCALATFSDITH